MVAFEQVCFHYSKSLGRWNWRISTRNMWRLWEKTCLWYPKDDKTCGDYGKKWMDPRQPLGRSIKDCLWVIHHCLLHFTNIRIHQIFTITLFHRRRRHRHHQHHRHYKQQHHHQHHYHHHYHENHHHYHHHLYHDYHHHHRLVISPIPPSSKTARTWTSASRRGAHWRWWVPPGRGRRPSPGCSSASTMWSQDGVAVVDGDVEARIDDGELYFSYQLTIVNLHYLTLYVWIFYDTW